MNAFEIIGLLIVFGALLFLVYVTTRYIGKKANKAMKGKYINIVESISLGLDKQLHLLRIGDEFVLIASAGKSVEFLTKVNLEQSEVEDEASNEPIFDFKSIFEKYINSIKTIGKSEKKEIEKSLLSNAEGEVFRSNLKKLKTINHNIHKHEENNDGDEITNEK